ncbi:MAG: hypothetical protein GWP08_13390 [Nitrospiraceae bacterium]|nr:hypothetical protein [Nitrospiraceae bacterium]
MNRRKQWLLFGIHVAASCLLFSLAVSADESRASYESDFAAFVAEVDNTYPFFDLKGNRDDWDARKTELAPLVAQCQSDSDFLGLVVRAIASLHDSHMWIRDAKTEVPPRPTEYYPGVSFMPATEERVAVMWASEGLAESLTIGTVITRIDREPARAFLERRAARDWGDSFNSSPQRTRLFAYRLPLKTATKGEPHTLTYLDGGKERELALTCDLPARGWPHTYNLPEGLTRVGRSFWYTQFPSGAGYAYVRRIDDSAPTGILQALAAHPDARGWIIDLRGNGGGGYGPDVIQGIKDLPRPVAVLIDAGCISAGETIARDLARHAEARLFGSRTAGASSAKRSWSFPSGIATVTFSTRSRWRNDGKPIEFNGIEPEVQIEAIPEEAAQGLNTAICRAEEYVVRTARAKEKAQANQ